MSVVTDSVQYFDNKPNCLSFYIINKNKQQEVIFCFYFGKLKIVSITVVWDTLKSVALSLITLPSLGQVM